MKYILFEEPLKPQYDVAILIKNSAFNQTDLHNHYFTKLLNQGVEKVMGFELHYENGKAPVKAVIEPYLDHLLQYLEDRGVKHLLVADVNYFKKLAGVNKGDGYYGYVLDCKYKGYTNMKVTLVPNYQAAFYDDKVLDKIDLSINALVSEFCGTYQEVGKGIIHDATYVPCNVLKVRQALFKLRKHPSITLDTETFNLKANRAGLGTIGFAWSEHEGICIDVDHGRKTTGTTLGSRVVDDYTVATVMREIRFFLETYKGNIKYHNATYDIKVLIRTLWMTHLKDTENLIKGLNVLTRDFDCTQAITYLATNSTAGNELSLKDQAQEFAGKYAVDVTDITKQPTRELLIYNLIDCLSTFYVYNKNYPIMVKDEQLNFYETMAKPILRNIIQMELTGMPLNMDRVIEVNKKLSSIINRYERYLLNTKTIKKFVQRKKEQEVIERNAAYKTKVIGIDEAKYEFNSGSGLQVAELLHDYLGFDVVSKTKTGLPATGGDELKGHMKRTTNKEHQNIIKAILKIEEGKKIVSTFISKFLDAERDDDGWYWLFGCFKFGGTISGRLSSSDPNLQNLPSGSTYGKLVKSCFQAPPGWLFVGLDFNSLEDNINILLTKDPAKRKIRLKGFDGHSYRCYHFWPEMFPDIDPECPDSINSLKSHNKRSDAKAPHFALQYLGTAFTLVKNCGFPKDEALVTEQRYLKMFKASYDWLDTKIEEASKNGYATLAFGLRLRTPVLSKTILGSSYTPNAATQERRSAGNAISGQSYGLLNSRLGFKLQEAVLDSPYAHDILPSAQIHDANYLVIRESAELLTWLNRKMTDLASWQDLPELQDPDIILGGELGVFYPAWHNEITIKNPDANVAEVKAVCKEGFTKYQSKLRK